MAAETMYVTVAGAGDKSGDTWAKAMDFAAWETDHEGGSEAGDIYYVAGGTHTLTGAFDASARNGSAVAPITIIGVKSGTSNEPPVYSDWASADDRPLIASGANLWRVGTFWKVFNLRMTTSASQGIIEAGGSALFNCKVVGDVSTSYGINVAAFGRVVNCEFVAGSGTAIGIYTGSGQITVLYCYVHDTLIGYQFAGGLSNKISFSIADTCSSKGIDLVGTHANSLLNNTIYNCGVGIDATTAFLSDFINNIINDCTTGANWTTQQDSNVWINNNLEGNGTPLTNVATALPHSDWLETTVNPAFTDDSGGDFSLATGSDCINAGLAITLGVG